MGVDLGLNLILILRFFFSWFWLKSDLITASALIFFEIDLGKVLSAIFIFSLQILGTSKKRGRKKFKSSRLIFDLCKGRPRKFAKSVVER